MSDENNSITTTHDLQLAACLAAAEGITDDVSPELESVARQKIVALRKRCEALSAAIDRISTAIDEYRPSLEPGTFGRFVADAVAGGAPRLVSDVAMGPELTSGSEPWFAPGGDHPAPVDGGQ